MVVVLRPKQITKNAIRNDFKLFVKYKYNNFP